MPAEDNAPGRPPEVLPSDKHNRLLVANVHPANWTNPTPPPRYNLVVIGGGTAGLIAAAGAAGLGARVALIERHLLGGDCLNVGCVPSKALIRSARCMAELRAAARVGVMLPAGTRADFPAVMERVRQVRASISSADSAARYRDMGVDVYFGDARFATADAVQVAGRTLRFKRAVIATGTRPAVPSIPGLQEAGFLTNETVFSLTELPRTLAVIGAGPIGCELAQAFARLGSEVYLVEAEHGVLSKEDRDAARLVQESLAHDGVHILCCGKELRIAGGAGGTRLRVHSHDQGYDIPVDTLLVATGRAANTEGLELEAAGVAYDKNGVQVDDHLRTTNKRIFAAGDICSRYRFTHVADAMARIVVQNALFHGRAKMSALTVPWCTYTDPEVAHVGLYEHEARQRGIATQIFESPLHHVDRARIDAKEEGFARVLVRRGSDRILGATIVADHAGDMISELTLAIQGGLGLKTLARTIHPYPTHSESLKRIADAYNRTRLTPRLRRMMEKWFAWTR